MLSTSSTCPSKWEIITQTPFLHSTLGQITLFVHKITWVFYFKWCDFCKILKTRFLLKIENAIFVKMRLCKYDFCEKCDFENVIFVKYEILTMRFLWTMRFWTCKFCEKCNFENAIFVKNVMFVKNVILKFDLCEKCDFEHVIFVICNFENAIFVKNVMFVKNVILKFNLCEKCDFENVIFVKNEIMKVRF